MEPVTIIVIAAVVLVVCVGILIASSDRNVDIPHCSGCNSIKTIITGLGLACEDCGTLIEIPKQEAKNLKKQPKPPTPPAPPTSCTF